MKLFFTILIVTILFGLSSAANAQSSHRLICQSGHVTVGGSQQFDTVCWYELVGIGSVLPDGYTPGTYGASLNETQTCRNIRSDRPLNCGNVDPGDAAEYPLYYDVAEAYGLEDELYELGSVERLWGCIGAGHDSLLECALAAYQHTAARCTDFDIECRMLLWDLDDMLEGVGGENLDPEQIGPQFGFPVGVSIAPDFSGFAEWIQQVLYMSKQQQECHEWHGEMTAAGCVA